jgi:hypothetical protein
LTSELEQNFQNHVFFIAPRSIIINGPLLRRRCGALRKAASSGSNPLRPLPRPESRPALQIRNSINFPFFQHARHSRGDGGHASSEDRYHYRSRCSLDKSAVPRLLNFIPTCGGRAMAIYFQIAHSNFCRKSRTPPFPHTDGPKHLLTIKTTTKSPFRGCPIVKFQASLTFHKTSSYAAFKNRPPCPLNS